MTSLAKRAGTVGALAVALATVGICLFLDTRANRFPLAYHPDEPTKVEQVLSGERDHHHPQLLLEAVTLATRALRTNVEPQDVVEVGRWVSALFAALAVCVLGALGYRVGGIGGQIALGAVTGACASLLRDAHYMKEDAALVMGLALVAFASWIVGRSPRLVSVTALGAACGVAASAKYVGALALLLALPVVIAGPGSPERAREDGRKRPALGAFVLRCLLFAGAAALTWVLIDHRVFWDFARFRGSLTTESTHAVGSHLGLTVHRPHAYFVGVLWRETPLFVQLIALGTAAATFTTWRRRSVWERTAAVFPLLYLAALSMSVITLPRHALPVVVWVHVLAGLGAVELARSSSKLLRLRSPTSAVSGPVVLGLFCATVAAVQVPIVVDTLGQFAGDSRRSLRLWMLDHVDPGSVIVADRYAALSGPNPADLTALPVPDQVFVVREERFAPEQGDLDDLRAQGVAYVAVCELAYGRFFDPLLSPVPDFAQVYARRRDWYARLFREERLVWSSAPARPIGGPTNPELRLYRISRGSVPVGKGSAGGDGRGGDAAGSGEAPAASSRAR